MIVEFVWISMIDNFHQNLADLFDNIFVTMRVSYNEHFEDEHASKNNRSICIIQRLQSKILNVIDVLIID